MENLNLKQKHRKKLNREFKLDSHAVTPLVEKNSIAKKHKSHDSRCHVKDLGSEGLIASNLDLRLQKQRKHKATNILASSFYHNNKYTNAEDLDINPNEHIKRPQSVISKSYINHLELAQKVRSVKRTSQPSAIDRLIKKSLLDARFKKISREKANKHSVLINEIKKKEIRYQNNQIRAQNYLKIKKKKLKAASKDYLSQENCNIYTLKTDSSNKFKRKYLSSEFYKKNSKKRCNSSQNYYHGHHSESLAAPHSDINLMKKNNIINQQLRKENNYSNSIIGYARNFENFSRENSLSSIEANSEFSDQDKKVSFISEKNMEEVVVEDDELRLQPGSFQLSSENVHKQSMAEQKHSKSLNSSRVHFETYLQPSYPSHLSDETIQVFSFIPQRPIKKSLSIHRSSQILVHKKSLQSEKSLNYSIETSTYSFSPPPKPNLTLQSASSHHISPQTPPTPSLSMKTTKIFYIAPSPTPIPYKSQLQEQYSWNSAHIFLIEQLKSFEMSSISELSTFLPFEIQSASLHSIEKKYSSLINYLNSTSDSGALSFLDELSANEHSVFITNTQKKKLILNKILLDSIESPPDTSFRLKPIAVPENSSPEISSEENSEERLGISHSKSVQSLINSPVAEIPVEEEKTAFKKELDFGYQEEVPEIKGKNNIKEELQTSKLMNLMLIPVDVEDSEPRFTTFQYAKELVEKVFRKIDCGRLIKELEKPLSKDPLLELDKLQELQIGTPVSAEIANFPELFDISKMSELELNPNEIDSLDLQMLKAERIHRKMLLYVLNYLLQQFRPYSYRGVPLPWDGINPPKYKILSIQEISEKVMRDFREICSCEIGRIEELEISNGCEDEASLLKLKEKQLDTLIHIEYFSEEYKWVDYTFEETQTKLDVADMILNELALEVILLHK